MKHTGIYVIIALVEYRGVAQFGRALRSGRRGRRFKSCHLDHSLMEYHKGTPLKILPSKVDVTGFEQAVLRFERQRKSKVKTLLWSVFKPPRR